MVWSGLKRVNQYTELRFISPNYLRVILKTLFFREMIELIIERPIQTRSHTAS